MIWKKKKKLLEPCKVKSKRALEQYLRPGHERQQDFSEVNQFQPTRKFHHIWGKEVIP